MTELLNDEKSMAMIIITIGHLFWMYRAFKLERELKGIKKRKVK